MYWPHSTRPNFLTFTTNNKKMDAFMELSIVVSFIDSKYGYQHEIPSVGQFTSVGSTVPWLGSWAVLVEKRHQQAAVCTHHSLLPHYKWDGVICFNFLPVWFSGHDWQCLWHKLWTRVSSFSFRLLLPEGIFVQKQKKPRGQSAIIWFPILCSLVFLICYQHGPQVSSDLTETFIDIVFLEPWSP